MVSAEMVPVRVDGARLADLVERLGLVGAQPGGGIIRPVYSPAWREAQDLVASLMGEAGLEVREDAVGNVVGTAAGTRGGDVVLTGSHVDTVTYGGAFDGALGVLSSIAAVEALLRDAGPPRRTVQVVSLCEEEGSRFHANYFGTRAILGLVEPDEPDRLVDAGGTTLADAARSVGLDPRRFGEAVRNDLGCFLELHIEQGRMLADAGIDVGIVDVITGVSWLEVDVEGRADHAGTTAMTDRLDAFQGAARMVVAVEAVALEEGSPAVATVGSVRVHPGGANIVPARAHFTVDVRHPDAATLERLVGRIRQRCEDIAGARGLTAQVEVVKHTPPHDLDATLAGLLRDAATACGASWQDMPSGAGHDSQTMATRIPTAMLFVPSVDGRSHSPAEYSTPHACGLGASVLATMLRAVAW